MRSVPEPAASLAWPFPIMCTRATTAPARRRAATPMSQARPPARSGPAFRGWVSVLAGPERFSSAARETAPSPRRAATNSRALGKRRSGVFASACPKTASQASGSSGLHSRGDSTGSWTTLYMIALTLSPSNGLWLVRTS